MNERTLKKHFNSIVIITLVITVFALGSDLVHERNYLSGKSELEPLKLIGSYYIEGESGSQVIPMDGNILGAEGKTVIVEGYFDKEISSNKQIIMRLDNLNIKVYVNEEQVYAFGAEQAMVDYSKSSGNLWDSFASPGIGENDNIRVELYSLYPHETDTTLLAFFNSIYMGYEGGFIIERISGGLANSIISMFIIFLGLISLGFALMLIKVERSLAKLIYFGGLCISSGIWCFIDFDYQNYLVPYPVFNNSLDILSLLFSMFFITAYLSLYLKSRSRYILYFMAGSFIVAIVAMIAMQLLGIRDYYENLIYLQMCAIYAPVVIFCMLYEHRKMRSAESKTVVLSTMILLVGITADGICNAFNIIHYMVWFKISYPAFIIVQYVYVTKIVRKALWESVRIELLKDRAYRDGLTGVYNRTAYMDVVNRLNKEPKIGELTALFVFDINSLKEVNDTWGHEAGDRLIQRCADALVAMFGTEEIYRIGGDEFVVFKSGVNRDMLRALQKRIKMVMKEYVERDTNEMPISMAYGVALYDAEIDDSYEEAFCRADREMYINKMRMKQAIIKENFE